MDKACQDLQLKVANQKKKINMVPIPGCLKPSVDTRINFLNRLHKIELEVFQLRRQSKIRLETENYSRLCRGLRDESLGLLNLGFERNSFFSNEQPNKIY